MRNSSIEKRIVEMGACPMLLSLAGTGFWPACLRDNAAGMLQSLSERWSNISFFGGFRYLEFPPTSKSMLLSA